MDQLEKFGNAIARLLTVVVGPLLDWMRQSYLKVGNATVFTWVTVGFLFCATFGSMEYLRILDRKPLLAAQAESARALVEWRMLSNDKLRDENTKAGIKRLRIEMATAELNAATLTINVDVVATGAVKVYALAYRDQEQNPQKILRESATSPIAIKVEDVPGTGDTVIIEVRAEFAGGVVIKAGELLYVPVGE